MSDQIKYLAKLKGKTVLVVGGTSGIGYAVAEAAIEHGAHVTITSSNPDRVSTALHTLQAAYPTAASANRISASICDLSGKQDLDEQCAALFEPLPAIDHIVYTAGEPIPPTPIAEASIETLRAAGATRYEGAVILIKHALTHLRSSNESSITLTTGFVVDKPIPGWSVLAGMRSAVLGLSKALALDLKPIRVNTVSVGPVKTNTWANVPLEQREKMFEVLAERTTTGRVAEAEDVAEAYVYLMKDRNVTGAVISSTGGALLV